MSYSATEPAELLAFRARLCGISTDAQSIRELSAQMRQPKDPLVQAMALQIWLADVRQTANSTRLLALFYLANDVIQFLRGSEQSVIYRYNFAGPLAEAIAVIRQKAPAIVPKIARVVAIFQERTIYDTHVGTLLQRAVQDDLTTVITTVIPAIHTETTLHRHARIKQLEREILNKNGFNSTATRQNLVQQSPAPAPVAPVSELQLQLQRPSSLTKHTVLLSTKTLPPPPLEDLILAGKELEKSYVFQRSQELVNLDAEVVSRIRGYRVPTTARIEIIDSKLIASYRMLLNENAQRLRDIDEKVSRRRKEEERSQFLLMPNRVAQNAELTASKRVEVLLKKEWNLRCQKMEIEHAIYWHLVTMLDRLCNRWSYVQSIVEGTETEMQRRNEGNQVWVKSESTNSNSRNLFSTESQYTTDQPLKSYRPLDANLLS